MHPAAKITITLTLLVILGGMGIADYYLSDGRWTAEVITDEVTIEETEESEATEATDDTMTQVNETGTTIPIPAGAIAKNQGPTVEQVVTELGMTQIPYTELTLLSQVVETSTTIQSIVLLKNNDRAGTVAWVEENDTKATFALLKDALITSFSPKMYDLRDETVQETAMPVRNILTFLDPALSEERILFVRVRNRLFEFHIAAGQDSTMLTFVNSLTKR